MADEPAVTQHGAAFRYCTSCGRAVAPDWILCPHCGRNPMDPNANTSGGGKGVAVPPEIDRWNWGAFFWNWIWGLGNRVYVALWALVPLVGLIFIFVLGAKG